LLLGALDGKFEDEGEEDVNGAKAYGAAGEPTLSGELVEDMEGDDPFIRGGLVARARMAEAAEEVLELRL